MGFRRLTGVAVLLVLLVAVGFSVQASAQESPPAVLWSAVSVPSNWDLAGVASVGADGHPIVAGTVFVTLDPLVTQIRVVKHDGTTGDVLWTTSHGTSTPVEETSGLAVGAEGHPFVTGESCASDFSSCSFRTLKLHRDTGAVIWSVAFSSGAGNFDVGVAIAVGPDGHLVATGFTCNNDFTVCNGRTIKYHGDTGATLWNVTFDDDGAQEEGDGIAVGPDGHPVVAMLTTNTTGPTFATILVKYDSATGAIVWTEPFAGTFARQVAIGADGHPVAAGTQCAGEPLVCDLLAVKYHGTTHTVLWSSTYDTGTDEFGEAVAIGADGHPVVVASACGASFCEGSPSDTIMVKLDGADGSLRWAVVRDDGDNEGAAGVAVGPDGNPVLVNRVCTPENFPCDLVTIKYVVQQDTPEGGNVPVALNGGSTVPDGLDLTYATVEAAGTTSVVTTTTGPTTPADVILGSPGTFYDLSTTASVRGSIDVCVNYGGRGLVPEGSAPQLLHFDNGVWVDATTSVNTTTQVVCGATTGLSPFTVAQPATTVQIDIRPKTDRNVIRVGRNRTIDVAILSSATFDARTVDPRTVTLAGGPVKERRNGRPAASFRRVNRDGRVDLVLRFDTETLHLVPGDTTAVLTGATASGQTIVGRDAVTVRR